MASLQDQLHATAQSLQSDANKYGALIGSNAHFAGVDQGIDFTGGPANVFALGPGVIERNMASGSGWPGQGALLTYRVTGGALKGQHVYIAEDFNPDAKLVPGTQIAKGQVLGVATGSGKAPGIETGYADATGRAFGSPTGGPQPYGQAFFSDVGTLSVGGDLATISNMFGVTPTTLSKPSDIQAGLGHVPGVAQVEGFAHDVSSVSGLIKFVTSWRFAEIVGGIILLVVGLFLVGRALGVSVPVGPLGSAAGSAADAAPGPISQQPRRVQKRAGFTLPVDQKPQRVKNEAAMSDEVPF